MSGGIVDQVRDAYRTEVGADPAGVWSAPGRVNLIGEHTDYNAGLCLPIALPHRTAVAAGARSDDRLVLTSLAPGLEPVEVDLGEVSPTVPGGWAAYVAGVVWALREEGYAVRGLDLVVDSAVPVGAGLSSSAALTCAVAAAADGVFGLGLLSTPRAGGAGSSPQPCGPRTTSSGPRPVGSIRPSPSSGGPVRPCVWTSGPARCPLCRSISLPRA